MARTPLTHFATYLALSVQKKMNKQTKTTPTQPAFYHQS